MNEAEKAKQILETEIAQLLMEFADKFGDISGVAVTSGHVRFVGGASSSRVQVEIVLKP